MTGVRYVGASEHADTVATAASANRRSFGFMSIAFALTCALAEKKPRLYVLGPGGRPIECAFVETGR